MSRINVGDIRTLVDTGIDGIKTVLTAINNFELDHNNFSPSSNVVTRQTVKDQFVFPWTVTHHGMAVSGTPVGIGGLVIPENLGVGFLTIIGLQAVTLSNSAAAAGTAVDLHYIPRDETTDRSTGFSIPSGAWVNGTPQEDLTGTVTALIPGDKLIINVTKNVADTIDPIVVTVMFQAQVMSGNSPAFVRPK